MKFKPLMHSLKGWGKKLVELLRHWGIPVQINNTDICPFPKSYVIIKMCKIKYMLTVKDAKSRHVRRYYL